MLKTMLLVLNSNIFSDVVNYFCMSLFISFCPVYRLEEKETEMKREYSKLHERYTDLLKTHMDTMERTKLLMGTTDRLDSTGRARIPTMSSLNPMSR